MGFDSDLPHVRNVNFRKYINKLPTDYKIEHILFVPEVQHKIRSIKQTPLHCEECTLTIHTIKTYKNQVVRSYPEKYFVEDICPNLFFDTDEVYEHKSDNIASHLKVAWLSLIGYKCGITYYNQDSTHPFFAIAPLNETLWTTDQRELSQLVIKQTLRKEYNHTAFNNEKRPIPIANGPQLAEFIRQKNYII